jgi:O-antigen/teichoic acid export membrane protein
MTRRLVTISSAWLIADKVVRLGVGLLVWTWLARHFGPAGFGLWNYAIAFVALFGAVASLGLDGVLVRELVRDPGRTGVLLGTATALRLTASVLSATVCVAAMAWLRPGEWLVLLLVAANAFTLVLQSSQTIDMHFQGRMNTRPAVVAVNLAFLLTTVGRLVLLALDAPMAWFAATLVGEAALAAALLVVAYRMSDSPQARWRFDAQVARKLLRESWPLALSAMAVMVYMRMDQVMLASMAGDEAVGQFSAALRIAEVWYFIPMAVTTAAFPAMMKKREEGPQAYECYLQSLYDGMAWLGITIAAIITLVAPWLIAVLYGTQFSTAAAVLTVQIWASFAVAMSFVHSRWLVAEGLQRYGLYYTLFAACVNVGLNLVLIPLYGAVGAAWATLATQVGTLPIQLLFPRARRNFLLMTRSLLAPLRWWQQVAIARP